MAETKEKPVVAEVIDENNVVDLISPLPNGKTTLVFDWDKVTGYTLINCAKSAKKEDPVMSVPALSLPYQAAVAAGVRYDDILSLKGPDFIKVTLKAQSFLLQSEA